MENKTLDQAIGFEVFGKEVQRTQKEGVSAVSISKGNNKFSFSKKCLEEMGDPNRILILRKGLTWFVLPTEGENGLTISGKVGSGRRGFSSARLVDMIIPKEQKEWQAGEYPVVKAAEDFEGQQLFKILMGNGRELVYRHKKINKQ